MSSIAAEYVIAEYVAWARRREPRDFDASAREARALFPHAVARILKHLGNWPSSEPELLALQKACEGRRN